MNRREQLIDRMNELESQGKSCAGCAGNCCTFEANSMLVTPLEAFELYSYLKKNNFLTEELKTKLQKNIQQYRLEPKYENNRRSYLRKTYTCPFFNHTELGCPLPRVVKPYGCLGFNTHHPELKAKEFCYSETHLLEQREALNLETEVSLNQALREQFHLVWVKAPIPNAILDIWNFK